MIRLIILPLVILQSSLTDLCIPIIFSRQWIAITPELALIHLLAIPKTLVSAAFQLLIAVRKSNVDLYWHLVFSTMLLSLC